MVVLRRSTKLLIGGGLVVTGGGIVVTAALAGFIAGVGIMQWSDDQKDEQKRKASVASLDERLKADASATTEPPAA